MKKSLKFINLCIVSAAAFSFFASCESTAQEVSSSRQDKTQNTVTEAPAKTENTSQFKKEVQDMKIELIAASDIPVAGTAFKTPYTVSVKHLDGTPYAEYKLTVNYPVEKTDSGVKFETAEIETNAKGNASFLPPAIATSMNSTVTFAPKAPGTNSSLEKIAMTAALEVPCKVRFALVKKAVVINLVDYDEKDRMVLDSALSTSSNLVQEFWKAGYPYQAQNADFHKAIDKGPDAVLEAAKNLFQGSAYFKYIIYGKIKYVGTIEEVKDGYSLTLTGTVTVIDYTTGKAYYTTTKTTTVTDKNKWNVLKACQVQLAKDLADDLVYSM